MVERFSGIPLEETIIMGVLNLSPKTFYKGSFAQSADEAADRAERMVEDGAGIIDLGAMSTGPNVEPISLKEEKELILPALKKIRLKTEVPISVDTQRAKIAEISLDNGADIINDVSGFKAEKNMPVIAARYDCSSILMANGIFGRIRTAEKEVRDIETVGDVTEALEESLEICEEYGVNTEQVAIDPAIGFGRGPKGDLRILANLRDLQKFEKPVCVGVSRKSFIGRALEIDGPSDRLHATLGATAVSFLKGANIIRTHDPKETHQLIRMMEAIKKEQNK